MQPILGVFGLGLMELIVLAVVGLVPLIAAAIVVFIVIRATRKKDEPGNE